VYVGDVGVRQSALAPLNPNCISFPRKLLQISGSLRIALFGCTDKYYKPFKRRIEGVQVVLSAQKEGKHRYASI